MDEIKEDVLDQASKTLSDAGTNAKDGVTESINKKTTDIFSSLVGKVSDSISSSANYLAQVEKMANEKRAKELGVTSRELVGLSTEQIAAKYGMTVEQYQERLKREAEQYETTNVANSTTVVKERAERELEARQNQATSLGLTMDEFNELTLQEQADKLNITLDQLLEERALNF